MKYARQQIIGVIFACAATGATAADPGMYYGAGAGIWSLDETVVDRPVEAQALQVRGQVGYRLNDHFSIEGSLHNYSEAEDGSFASDGLGVQFALRPSFPLSDSIEAYGRLGWGYYDLEASIELGDTFDPEDATWNDLTMATGVDRAADDQARAAYLAMDNVQTALSTRVETENTDSELVWGLGVNFRVSRRMSVYIEYSEPFDGRADVYTLGLTWHPQGR